MSVVSLPERRPALLATSGRQPLVLPAALGQVRVETGRVNLFVERLLPDGAGSGERRLAATLDAGAQLPLPACDLPGLRLLLVGVGEARVASAPLSGTSEGGTPLDAAALEAGLRALLTALGPDPAGMAATALGPERESAVSGGDAGEPPAPRTVERRGRFSAHRLLWLEVRGTPEPEAGAPEGRLLRLEPVAPGRSLEVASGCRVRALDCPQLLREHGEPAVRRWAAELFAGHGEALREAAEARRRRARRRRLSDRRQLAAALGRLPEIVAGRRSPVQVGEGGAGTDQALAALETVCAAERIDFEAPSGADPSGAARAGTAEPDAGPSVADRLAELLRRANLRFRRVHLEPGWWRRDGSSFVGFLEGVPVAVVRRGAGRFECLRGGAWQRVDEHLAETLEPRGLVVFRPLPQRPLKALDLVRHVLATPARVDLRWAAGLAIAAALLGLLPPYLTGKLLNEVVPFAETGMLVHLGLGLGAVALGSALFQAVRSVALLRVESFADGALQAAVWDRLLRLPLAFFRRYEVGDLLIKAMGPTQLRQALSDTVLSAALSALFSLVNFALMLSYDATLALAAVAFTLLTGGLLFGLSYLQLRHERARLKAEARASSFVLQMLTGIQKLRLMGAENRAYARWLQRFADQRQQSQRAARVGNLTATLNAVLPILASILFFYLVGAAEGRIPVGDFVAFNAAFGVFHGALLTLVGALSESLAAVPVYENMKPLLAEQPELDPERRAPGPLEGAISIRNVTFRYEADGPTILDGVDLEVEPGQFVALVGPSGSGKSTLFRLLLGFETPESGTVGYDGQDLARLDLKAVRRQIGVVLQRGAILPGSLFENIVGSAPLTHDDAWEAARLAGFDEDVRRLPMGMHTLLSEGGGTLSGGQRQRLMIARAIVRRPRILLMDEATSALDNRTQAIVAQSLAELSATRLVIAHRLSTVVNADRIHVIERGRVVQSGTYDELMAVPGPFRRIAEPQLQ